MSLSTIITEGYGTFGSRSFVIMDGYDLGQAPPPVAVVVPQPSGGWPIPGKRKKLHLPAYPTAEQLRKQREELGILPKTAAIIESVAQRQAAAMRYDEQRYFEELNRELELQGIEFEGRYLESLNIQRIKIIDAEIGRLLKIQLDKEDMEVIIAIVAASI